MSLLLFPSFIYGSTINETIFRTHTRRSIDHKVFENSDLAIHLKSLEYHPLNFTFDHTVMRFHCSKNVNFIKKLTYTTMILSSSYKATALRISITDMDQNLHILCLPRLHWQIHISARIWNNKNSWKIVTCYIFA